MRNKLAPKVCTEHAHAGTRPPLVAGFDHQGREIFHVLHEREGYPLTYWFTYNASVVQSGWRIHPDHFDIRLVADPFAVSGGSCIVGRREAGSCIGEARL